jgi:nucleoside-diphosphate-sugar epimerase
MPSALITGATGFIGSHLSKELSNRGYSLKALVRSPSANNLELPANCEIIQGDLSDTAKLREAVRGVDYVFHCAANVATWDTPKNYQRANVDGVINLCLAIREANPSLKRVIHLSTVDVYDFPNEPADENTKTQCPRYNYGASKLQGEQALEKCLTTAKLPYCILRPCNVIGSQSPFISRIGDALRNGFMIEINNGVQNAGLLSVETLINCMIWASESPAANNQVFNVRNPENMNWHEFLIKFKRGIQGRGLLLNLPYPAANALGNFFYATHKIIAPLKEPLWHPLLTEIFGKTCGHSIRKIQCAGAPLESAHLEDAIADSIRWYNQQHA